MEKFPYHLYTISGMGLDEHLFSKLDLPFESVNHIKWIDPLSSGEPIESYAKRLLEQVHHTERIMLLGCSFGGIMAKELSYLMEVERIIIVSSLKNAKERPLWFDTIGLVPLHNFTPKWVKDTTFPIWAPLFGLHKPHEQQFFGNMFRKTSQMYKDWATTRIARWRNINASPNTLHIHGDKDRIFPISTIRNCEVIPGGDHSMIVKRAEEVSKIIRNYVERWVGQENEVV